MSLKSRNQIRPGEDISWTNLVDQMFTVVLPVFQILSLRQNWNVCWEYGSYYRSYRKTGGRPQHGKSPVMIRIDSVRS
jgi:hypothetical protein